MITRLARSIAVALAIPAAWAVDPVPVAQQNLLVQQYCAACHDDVKMVALSLQHYDAANPDPGLTAMLLSRMKDGAFGAAGIPVPGKLIREALLSASLGKSSRCRHLVHDHAVASHHSGYRV